MGLICIKPRPLPETTGAACPGTPPAASPPPTPGHVRVLLQEEARMVQNHIHPDLSAVRNRVFVIVISHRSWGEAPSPRMVPHHRRKRNSEPGERRAPEEGERRWRQAVARHRIGWAWGTSLWRFQGSLALLAPSLGISCNRKLLWNCSLCRASFQQGSPRTLRLPLLSAWNLLFSQALDFFRSLHKCRLSRVACVTTINKATSAQLLSPLHWFIYLLFYGKYYLA